MEKEVKIVPPEGYEIDKENSIFECIKFKLISKKRWRDDENVQLNGYYITEESYIYDVVDGCCNCEDNYNVFATEKQAKSALAMARISQIMANDKRFGGAITDEEWNSTEDKYVIERIENTMYPRSYKSYYHFLAFHTLEQRDLFLEENLDLIKDYLML